MKSCPECGGIEIYGIEYALDSYYYYDGISEWRCLNCGTRIGRWTERVLSEEEAEPPFGRWL